MPKVFLDKIVTSAHVPPSQGSRKYISTTTFPDLSHTMISTKFCPILPSATTPNGEMTRTYKHHAFRQYQTCERPSAELKMKVKFFKRAHHVFANKVLLDLERMKITRNERRQKIWTQGKKDLGFESDGRLGDDSYAYGGDDFEVAEDYNPSIVETKFPAGEDAFGNAYEYGSEAFELSTPLLAAVMPADAPNRPATSVMPSSSGIVGGRAANNATPGPLADPARSGDRGHPHSPSSSSSASSPAAAVSDDKRVGMQSRLQAKNNALIAEEEAKFVRSHDSVTDIALKAVGRGVNAGKGRASASASSGSLSSTHSRDSEPISALQAKPGIDSNNADGQRADAGDDGGHHKSAVTVTFNLATSSRAASSTTLDTSQRQREGISPPRVRGAFSRETYFECLFDTMDIPQPHAARFGMLQSPKCKTSSERYAQRRAQTAEFVPRMTKSLAESVPDRGASVSPVEAGMTTETTRLEDPVAIAGAKAARASPIQVDPPPHLRRLSKGSLKDVLGRLATASQAVRHPNSLTVVPRSPIGRGALIPSSKWREEAMDRAITGDKYGEYKVRAYR